MPLTEAVFLCERLDDGVDDALAPKVELLVANQDLRVGPSSTWPAWVTGREGRTTHRARRAAGCVLTQSHRTHRFGPVARETVAIAVRHVHTVVIAEIRVTCAVRRHDSPHRRSAFPGLARPKPSLRTLQAVCLVVTARVLIPPPSRRYQPDQSDDGGRAWRLAG
jgi:hypothetical protein